MENKAIIGFTEALEEAVKLQTAKNYEDAALILGKTVEIVEEAGMYEDTDDEKFFCFNNVLEQILYNEVFNPGKELKQVPDNYADMYHKYGALLFEAKRYDEAEAVLKKAVRWNPVDTDILFELSEVYKVRGDWETFLPIMKQCLAYAYSKRALARSYRNLGFYFIEQEKYDTAAALYLFSLFFESENETAYYELGYIKEKTGKTPHQPSNKEEASVLIKLIEDNGVQTWANPQVIDIALSMGREAMKGNMPDEVRYFLGIAYELSGDKEIGEVLERLEYQDEDEYEQDEGKYDGEI